MRSAAKRPRDVAGRAEADDASSPEEPAADVDSGASRRLSARVAPKALWAWLTGGGFWRQLGVLAVTCVIFVMLLSAFVVQPFLVPSGSMEGTLHVGDRIMVNKLAYHFGAQPRRGDVVVFDGTESFDADGPTGNPVTRLLRGAAAAVGLAKPAETDYVKRVIGVGGDRVACCDSRGRIEVNGEPLDEEYVYPGDAPSRVEFETVVPHGELWVMGDRRDASRDSRDLLGSPGGGTVPVARVIGRADWVGWPLNRWSRLGHPSTFDHVPPGGVGPDG